MYNYAKHLEIVSIWLCLPPSSDIWPYWSFSWPKNHPIFDPSRVPSWQWRNVIKGTEVHQFNGFSPKVTWNPFISLTRPNYLTSYINQFPTIRSHEFLHCPGEECENLQEAREGNHWSGGPRNLTDCKGRTKCQFGVCLYKHIHLNKATNGLVCRDDADCESNNREVTAHNDGRITLKVLRTAVLLRPGKWRYGVCVMIIGGLHTNDADIREPLTI